MDRLFKAYSSSASSPTLAEISGHADYDFVVVDMEHGRGGISQARSCLHALAANHTPAILRLPENSLTWAQIASGSHDRRSLFRQKSYISYCKYWCTWSCTPIVRASKYGIDEEYLIKYEKELLIMCQVESEEGVKRIGEMAGLDVVDFVMMGPLDLSPSVSVLAGPGKFESEGDDKVSLEGSVRKRWGVPGRLCCLARFSY